MIQFNIADHADQEFSAVLSQRRVTIRLRHNPIVDRWSFDIAVDGAPVLHGRRIVTGVDLLEPFELGVGAVFALSEGAHHTPGRSQLPAGLVRLYHADEGELDAAIS